MSDGETVTSLDLAGMLAAVQAWLLTEGVKIVLAVGALILSFLLINAVVPWVAKSFQRRKKADKTVIKTVAYVAKIALKLSVVVILVGYLGLDTSGIAALITSFGVALGLAIQGAFSNFAGGLLLLITRPFGVDDYVEVCGESGTVTDIHIVYTLLQTPDHKVISLPNGSVANSTIVNYSKNPTRRVDVVIHVAPDTDVSQAREIALGAFARHPLICKEPPPAVYLGEQSVNGVQISARCWVRTEHYWTVYYETSEQIRKLFLENGIRPPYQRVSIGGQEGSEA